ncbi:Receptor family ligand binding region [Popillia japonica]|uniref:Receptor family ligand binding region n=1 Tax=Popillia japonica TaxID=7064 RepID=A0AAW1MNG6_POPJA
MYWPVWVGAVLIHCLGGVLPHEGSSHVLHIGGIFPIRGQGGWQGGQACMPAAELALEDVNKRKDLLPGYILRLHSNDSECEPGLGASVMYNLLYNQPQKLMLLAGCSTVCTTVAEAAKMWNLVVLCYGASSPALSDRNRFPTLFRTHPSATVHNPTRIKLMKKFGWSRVAILQQAEEVFISTVEDLETRCMEAGIEIITRQSFLSDPTDAVRNLRRQDSRVVVGLFYVVAARRVLCEVYKQKLYGKSYVWFFIGWYEDNWFEINLTTEDIECTVEEMREAAEGHLTTEAIMWNQNKEERTTSGMTIVEFKNRLDRKLEDNYDIKNKRYPEGYQEAPLAYDAVWSVALAFNKTMDRLHKYGKRLTEFNYNNKEIADEIYSAINSTQFLGISGFVAFSSQGDRIALTQIEQVINGSYKQLGFYDTQADNLTWFDVEVWNGGKVPQDRTIIKRVLRTVSLPLFICMCIVSSAGIAVAIGLIIFNIWHSHRRVIQSSHPVCNTIMLVGIIVCLISVFLLGLDGNFVSPEAYPSICQSRAWLLTTGFTLSYGAMFSKVWRVHRLTTKLKSDHKKKVEPWKLYSMVSGLLVLDISLLLCWQIIDPLQRKLEQFPWEQPTNAADDFKLSPELEHCESHNNILWLGIVYGYKGLVLVNISFIWVGDPIDCATFLQVFGLFLAYKTRSVKVKQINDSRYVGMSIYNVVVLCLITAPVTMVIASQQDASYTFVALAIIFCCFLSMALIFVPKVIEVVRHPRDKAESKYNPDAGVSKEEEERYQKLVTENEELQRLIAQKEEKIKILRERLAEKETSGKGSTLLVPTAITQGKDTLIVADFITDAGTSDSAFGGGISVYTRSSRASQSDFEFSESGKVPQDRTIIKRVLRTVSLPLFICMCIVSSAGIAVAIGLIIFNIWHSHRRVIQSSHPVCNTIMLVGIIVCLISVFLLGLDGNFVSPEAYPSICQSRAWLLTTGFTLSYGAMFSKVWRVHRLTTKLKSDHKVRMKKVEPWKLYSMVSGLLVLDISLLLCWQIIDPLQRKLEQFPWEQPTNAADDFKLSPELEHCESHNNILWLGIVYGYKGLVLVFGLFLAYETRSVKVKQINDSRYVGMSIYNVVVLCLITAPVTMVIASQQDASYTFVALAIIFCCFLSMALIFVPKVIEVVRHPRDKAESKYNPDAGVSKEEEERYQKLVTENEELQRLIAQKEEKIKILRERLAEKETSGKGSTLLVPTAITQDVRDEHV